MVRPRRDGRHALLGQCTAAAWCCGVAKRRHGAVARRRGPLLLPSPVPPRLLTPPTFHRPPQRPRSTSPRPTWRHMSAPPAWCRPFLAGSLSCTGEGRGGRGWEWWPAVSGRPPSSHPPPNPTRSLQPPGGRRHPGGRRGRVRVPALRIVRCQAVCGRGGLVPADVPDHQSDGERGWEGSGAGGGRQARGRWAATVAWPPPAHGLP